MTTTILALVAAAASDIGRVRRGNEDAYLVAPPVYAIADGMGGHRGGAVAAQLAIRTLASRAADLASADGEALVAAVADANRAIVLTADEDDALRGMATTCTAALVRGRVARIAHVGDSRAYLLHEGRLAQLTDDHSVVAQLVREGQLSPEDAAVHPGRSVIFRALGTQPEIEVDMIEVVLDADDRLLLCSDGLTGMLGTRRSPRSSAMSPTRRWPWTRWWRAPTPRAGPTTSRSSWSTSARRRNEGSPHDRPAGSPRRQRPRPVPDRVGHRARRDGRRLPGHPRRPRPQGGPQAAGPRLRRRRGVPGPLPARIADGGRHRPPQHHPDLRGRRGRRGLLPGHALRGRHRPREPPPGRARSSRGKRSASWARWPAPSTPPTSRASSTAT